MQHDAANDPTLLNIKKIAERGGERGPLYDRGVLSVVDQVEQHGEFTTDPMCGLVCMLGVEQGVPVAALTGDERNRVYAELARRGWSFEQAVEFYSGVEFAQKMLFRYRKDEGPVA